MKPDRHLGAAQIGRLQLDLLITESTYATTIRDSRYGREREFLKAVHNCVAAGGKVLIPTFALGRAQELFILLEDYGERMNLKVPIYFSAGLTIQANMNCVAGTIGHKLMSGKPTKIDLDKDTRIDVRCQIHQLSFSPHTDAKGIMDLVKFLSPKHAILVHGEKPKMATLKERIQSELAIPCYCPSNNETVTIPSTLYVKADASSTFIQSCLNPNFKFSTCSSVDKSYLDSNESKVVSRLSISDDRVSEGILVVGKGKRQRLYTRMSF